MFKQLKRKSGAKKAHASLCKPKLCGFNRQACFYFLETLSIRQKKAENI